MDERLSTETVKQWLQESRQENYRLEQKQQPIFSRDKAASPLNSSWSEEALDALRKVTQAWWSGVSKTAKSRAQQLRNDSAEYQKVRHVVYVNQMITSA